MSIKLAKRIASALMGRGLSAVKVRGDSIEEAGKAITRDDVKHLVQGGAIYADKAKSNVSAYSKAEAALRHAGKKRGSGRGAKRGTRKARASVEYKKRIRGQRAVVKALKADGTLDNKTFKALYALVRGSTFQSKAQLLHHIRGRGIAISDERFEQLRHASGSGAK